MTCVYLKGENSGVVYFGIFAGKVRMFSKSPDLSDIAQNTESLALVSKLQLMGEHFMVENNGFVFF